MSSLLTKSLVQHHLSRVSPIQLRDFPLPPNIFITSSFHGFKPRRSWGGVDVGCRVQYHYIQPNRLFWLLWVTTGMVLGIFCTRYERSYTRPKQLSVKVSHLRRRARIGLSADPHSPTPVHLSSFLNLLPTSPTFINSLGRLEPVPYPVCLLQIAPRTANSNHLPEAVPSKCPTGGERLNPWYTKFNFTVGVGKERLPPSREKN